MKKAIIINIFVFTICFIYAIIRYNVYGNVPYSQIPVFTLNKAVAFAAMFSICLSVFWKRLSDDVLVRKYLGLQGFFFAVFHAILSLAILRPDYYTVMFDNNMLSIWGNLTVLMGASALMIFALAAFYSISENLKNISALVFFGILLLAIHIMIKGFHSWSFDKWIAKLVPISLVSFIFVIITIMSKFFPDKKRKP